MPGNRDVWEIIRIASNQWRAGLGGVYGLDFSAIILIAQALDVETDYNFFEKIRILEAEILRIIAPDPSAGSGACNKEQKEKCKVEFGEYLEWACKNCETQNPKSEIKIAHEIHEKHGSK